MKRKTQAEEELRLDILENQVQERTAALNATLKQLKAEIEERQRVSHELKLVNDKLSALVQASPLPIISLDLNCLVLSWNQAAESLFGWSREEVLGRTNPTVPQENLSTYQDLVRRIKAGETLTGIEAKGRCRNGALVDLNLHAGLLRGETGEVLGSMFIVEDITRRKGAEAELQRLRHHQEILLNSVWEGIIGLDNNENVTFANRAAARLLGYEPEELIGRHGHSTWHHSKPEGSPFPAEECPLLAAIREGTTYCGTDEVFWRKDSTSFPVEYSVAPIFNGEIGGGVVTFWDASRCREAESLSRSLVETSPIGIYLLQNGKFVLTNRWFHTITGYSEEDLAYLVCSELVHPDDRFAVRGNAVMMLKGKSFIPYEYRHLTKTGETKWIMETITSIRYKGKKCTLAYFMDITERKQLEDRLLHAQKMEAVGRLAGGVAHDFNNMLTAIMGYADLLLGTLKEGDPLCRQVLGISKATERAATLTRQLLAFSRKQIMQPQVLNLNTVVQDTEGMLRRLIGEDIKLLTTLDPALGNIKADPGQIEQVIMNLAVNARDAMPQGGKLVFETANITFTKPHDCKFEIASPGHYVMLGVSDSGIGMDAKMQGHLFEPFYTTKEVGKGTGLGLSTVYGIVKQSDGCIEVHSRPGVGTTFKIYFPQVEEAVAPVVITPPTKLAGSETILVVEDDELLRQMIADALGMNGYQVLPAGNGGEAFLLGERHQAPIHLMLTDVVMPNLSGLELAERLAPRHPEMKVLYMSGYTEDIINRRRVMEEGTHFIQKPFTPAVLIQKVRQVLES